MQLPIRDLKLNPISHRLRHAKLPYPICVLPRIWECSPCTRPPKLRPWRAKIPS